MLGNNLLLHRCTIQTRTATDNDFGEPVYGYADTYTNVPCRYSSPKGNKIRSDSGEFVVDNPKLFLKPDQDVSENCRIVGTTGFTETYSVLKVNKRYDNNKIHHIDCELRKVV